ncbi:Heme O synthase, protoheme IX farnesyltransferase COX10-CtaB [hydrothermal vent metagenome]|uniref:Heme O synthase, protoheme IX farnesyltransferase COX10-CtaB n=1 Tax=hydrothermal vent metagenome TaxID=652676 RepID=A0A3B1DT68_9ZZZZ
MHLDCNILKNYIELTKPRILALVLVTTVLGFFMGGEGIISYALLAYLLIGTALTCAGSSVLNQYLERDFDSKMERTKNRPIPAGTISPAKALNFGIILILSGIFLLYVKTNILTAFLSLLTTFLYILVYTPMKRINWLNTTIGAIPGAIPPLGGWAAATGTLNFHAGVLFLILFLWQHPHFYAIAWMLKEDYRKAGFQMLPVIDKDGKRTFQQILIFSIILIPVSIIPALTGLSGRVYLLGAIISGMGLLFVSKKLIDSHTIADARNLLKATVIYLPILLILIVSDATF